MIVCNLYVSDKVSILLFDEDANENKINDETLNFILVKRDNTNSFNNITYISTIIENKIGNQDITNITKAVYDINNTNPKLNLDDYNMTINYNKKVLFLIMLIDILLNNSEDTWFYKLIKDSTNL